MKNIVLAIALVAGFTACNSKKTETRDIQLLSDSSAYNNSMYSDTSNDMEIVATPPSQSGKPKSVIPKTHTSANSGNTANSTNAGTSATTSTQTTSQTEKKKGWSSAAKGAVIGAGAGAIGGAIIGKKKPVKGAVVGGVVGAAGGYIIGKDIDKRKGR